ncbi:type III-B CRISPR module-associated protein Cmr5 [Thermococcus sp. 18S1]|uniref:type III-B CRISPR module-associated protein Cmr5 n=1 Tax=Thermococcus sp. 18S1 TaxID=1638210 RepID=UPI00143CA7FC|nr:type III-B CRISPR module-associated protein Cmr5 [Thermococcus sp. 18S1]NJE31240.1 type III-B CRISPR module-associated protein Cmr5 [Thermococcus sp. 18S1]
MRSIEHERGAFAYSKISEVKDKGWAGDYKGYVKRAPAMIMTNGLAQTLAFYRSKQKPAYNALFNHINEWLKRREYLEGNCERNPSDILEWLVYCASDFEAYQATVEVLALLNWMRRFADAMIEKKESDE